MRISDESWHAAVTELQANNRALPKYRQCHGHIETVLIDGEYRPRFANCHRYQCSYHGQRNGRRFAKKLSARLLELPKNTQPYFVTVTACKGVASTQTLAGFKSALSAIVRALRDTAKKANVDAPHIRIVICHGQQVHSHLIVDWLPDVTPCPTENYPNKVSTTWSLSAERLGLSLHCLAIRQTDTDYARVALYLGKNLAIDRLPKHGLSVVVSPGYWQGIQSLGYLVSTQTPVNHTYPRLRMSSALLAIMLQSWNGETPMKACSICGKEYPNTAQYYQKSGSKGLRRECKGCTARYDRQRNQRPTRKYRRDKMTDLEWYSHLAAHGEWVNGMPDDMPIQTSLFGE